MLKLRLLSKQMQTSWRSVSGGSNFNQLVCHLFYISTYFVDDIYIICNVMYLLVCFPLIIIINFSLLVCPGCPYRTNTSLRASVVADAFVTQMTSEDQALRASKEKLEHAVSLGEMLEQPTQELTVANEQYRKASAQIRKNCSAPKTKAGAKAKAKAAA